MGEHRVSGSQKINHTAILAHYDGQSIQLDEPCTLDANDRLLIVVLPRSNDDSVDWTRRSLDALENAYGDDEPEYSLPGIKLANPDFDGR